MFHVVHDLNKNFFTGTKCNVASIVILQFSYLSIVKDRYANKESNKTDEHQLPNIDLPNGIQSVTKWL